VARLCAQQQIQVISGGARGVDREAMLTALEDGGRAVGVLAGDLTRASLLKPYREAICRGQLALLSPYDPDAGFTVGNAMGRNKHLYALADWSLVVCTTQDQGGTWAGAIENLKAKWAPLFVRSDDTAPEGNVRLIRQGGLPLSREDLGYGNDIGEWLNRHSAPACEPPRQDVEPTAPSTAEAPPSGARQLSLLEPSDSD